MNPLMRNDILLGFLSCGRKLRSVIVQIQTIVLVAMGFLLSVSTHCAETDISSSESGQWVTQFDSGRRPAIHNASSISGEYQRFYLDENSTLDSVSLVVYSEGGADCDLQVYSHSRGNIYPHETDLVFNETIHLDSGYNEVQKYVGLHLEEGQFFVGVSTDKSGHIVRIVSDRVTNKPECENEFGEVFTYQVMRTKGSEWINGFHDYNIGVHFTTDEVDSPMFEIVNDCNLPESFHSEIKSLVLLNSNDDDLPDVLMNGKIWNNVGGFRFVAGPTLTTDTLGVFFAVDLNGVSGPEIVGFSNRPDIESQVFRRRENGSYQGSPVSSPVSMPSVDILSVSTIDWNRDGLNDVLMVVSDTQVEAASTSKFAVLFGSRDDVFDIEYVDVEGVSNPRTVSIADIDRNGVKDVIVRTSTELSVHYRESDGSIISSTYKDVSLLVGSYSGDIILQNDPLLGMIASTLVFDRDLFASLEDGTKETGQFLEGVSLHSACMIGDLDLDGTDDAVLLSGCTCRTVEVQSDIFGERDRATIKSGLVDVALDESAVLIDLDGDSDLDVLGHTGTYLRVFENTTVDRGMFVGGNEFSSNQPGQQSDCSGLFFSSWFNREQTLGNDAIVTGDSFFNISTKPNPSVDYVIVTIESDLKEVNSSGTMTLINSIGEVVVRESIAFANSAYRFDFPFALGSGAYQLTVESESGSSSTLIVVQR